jgi:hypothetical protein
MMDIKALENFDFANIDSVLEKREILLSKIILTEQRQRQEDRLNLQYHEMLQKVHKRHIEDKKSENEMIEKVANLSNVVEELQNVQDI